MKFSIITPTCKRAEMLSRAVESVLFQTHTDWEMIIVNDSPDDTSYSPFEKTLSDDRIIYLKNEQNKGVNFSRNRAINNISKNSEWVIFLDDDDYLALDALETFFKLATTHPDQKWFITNRAYSNRKSLTNFPRSNMVYNYAWDYLIFKKCRGDATHCINTAIIGNTRFSKLIKQAEEWIFFYQIGLKSKIFYHNHNSTITDGYSENTGLNFRKRSCAHQLRVLLLSILDGYSLHLLHHPTFLFYLFIRLVRTII